MDAKQSIQFIKDIAGNYDTAKGVEVYAIVTSRSRTNQTRYIKFYIVSTNKQIYNITYHIFTVLEGHAPATEKERDQVWNKGIKATGSGMDMIFNTLCNFNVKAAQADGLPFEPRQEYNYLLNTDYRSL